MARKTERFRLAPAMQAGLTDRQWKIGSQLRCRRDGLNRSTEANNPAMMSRGLFHV